MTEMTPKQQATLPAMLSVMRDLHRVTRSTMTLQSGETNGVYEVVWRGLCLAARASTVHLIAVTGSRVKAADHLAALCDWPLADCRAMLESIVLTEGERLDLEALGGSFPTDTGLTEAEVVADALAILGPDAHLDC